MAARLMVFRGPCHLLESDAAILGTSVSTPSRVMKPPICIPSMQLYTSMAQVQRWIVAIKTYEQASFNDPEAGSVVDDVPGWRGEYLTHVLARERKSSLIVDR